jgi:hypothetical protein
MKLQYLGDSKDSFKWDYHDYLTSALEYPRLNIIPMLTPDDRSNNGKTRPELYSAKESIIDFCQRLRKEENLNLLQKLPNSTLASYRVDLHKPDTYFTNQKREKYFSEISAEEKCLFFLDPDNGFEPRRSRTKKHVLYSDIEFILNQINEESIISVFQHFRRIPFDKDFAQIKAHFPSNHIAAVYWHFLMFVTIAKTKETIKKVIYANCQYAKKYPVRVLQ